MKKGIHPKYYKNVKVTCSCGATFTTGSTLENINIEVCSQCHPFYTGKEKIIDTMNLVKKFEDKKKAAKQTKVVSRKAKRASRREKRAAKVVSKDSGLTLKDMLKQMK